MSNHYLSAIFVLSLFCVEMNVVMGLENCNGCSTVNGCLAQCFDMDPWITSTSFSSCKASCASSGSECAIRSGTKCYCAGNCNSGTAPLLVTL